MFLLLLEGVVYLTYVSTIIGRCCILLNICFLPILVGVVFFTYVFTKISRCCILYIWFLLILIGVVYIIYGSCLYY